MLKILQDKAGRANSWLLMLLMFVIPFPPAGSNIIAFFILLLWLFEADFKRKWYELKVNPLFWAFLAYLLIYPISLLWTENMEWGLHILTKHLLYLYFPIFLTIVKKEHIKFYLGAFVASITLSEVVSYLVWFELIHLQGVLPSDPTPFIDHIAYNPLLAITIYYLMHILFFEKAPLWQKAIYSFFIATMTLNMFITGGRAGQVAYLVVVGLLFIQYFYRKGLILRGAAIGLIFLTTIFSTAYQFSSIFQQRADMAIEESMQSNLNDNGSVTSRIRYVVNTLDMISIRPILGSGIGDFPDDYANINQINTPGSKLTVNPHNQYLLVAASTGLVGLVILLSIFWFQFKAWRESDSKYNDLRLALMLLFGVIMFSDSYLMGHVTAIFFITMSAILYKKGIT